MNHQMTLTIPLQEPLEIYGNLIYLLKNLQQGFESSSLLPYQWAICENGLGIYLIYDESGKVIYVGGLRKREDVGDRINCLTDPSSHTFTLKLVKEHTLKGLCTNLIKNQIKNEKNVQKIMEKIIDKVIKHGIKGKIINQKKKNMKNNKEIKKNMKNDKEIKKNKEIYKIICKNKIIYPIIDQTIKVMDTIIEWIKNKFNYRIIRPVVDDIKYLEKLEHFAIAVFNPEYND